MADQKITELTAMTVVAKEDLLAIVDDVAGVPLIKKVTLLKFLEVINGLTAETAPAVADELALYDASASATDKVTLANLFKVINALTAETSPATDDELALYDASGSATDKITLVNLLKVVSSLTELAAGPDPTADDILIIDNAADAKYINVTNLLKVVDGLTELAEAPAASDTLLLLDNGTPKKLQYSNLEIGGNRRYYQLVVEWWTISLTTGDGKYYLHIPNDLNGLDLVECHAEVITAGTTNTTDIQIRNVTDSVDMLSTKLTIDTAETGSDTAATPYVIDTAKDDVAENDVLAIDIDAINTTAPKGLIITLGFE